MNRFFFNVLFLLLPLHPSFFYAFHLRINMIRAEMEVSAQCLIILFLLQQN